ncbi:hypothetical protein GQ457_03G020590 [Hibiscus cannabinus]
MEVVALSGSVDHLEGVVMRIGSFVVATSCNVPDKGTMVAYPSMGINKEIDLHDGDVIVDNSGLFLMIKFSDSLHKLEDKNMRQAKIVRLLGPSINYHVVWNKIQALRKTVERVQLVDMDKDYFIVKFTSTEDYTKALTARPSTVFGSYLTLQPWSRNFLTSQSYLSKVMVWMRLPGLPYRPRKNGANSNEVSDKHQPRYASRFDALREVDSVDVMTIKPMQNKVQGPEVDIIQLSTMVDNNNKGDVGNHVGVISQGVALGSLKSGHFHTTNEASSSKSNPLIRAGKKRFESMVLGSQVQVVEKVKGAKQGIHSVVNIIEDGDVLHLGKRKYTTSTVGLIRKPLHGPTKKLCLELDLVLEQEEVMWVQKARCQWIVEGDHNTKYFHGLAKGRRKSNSIFTLWQANGSWCTDQRELHVEGELNPVLSILILKVEVLEFTSQFGPISLCKVTYKILSKVKEGRIGWMAIKLDLEKAYDRNEWSFIEDTLSNVWIKMHKIIMSCVKTVSTQTLWNEAVSEAFKLTWGVRQGDPLSSYLFSLCMERLAHAINLVVQSGEWRVIRINHFYVAYITLILCG